MRTYAYVCAALCLPWFVPSYAYALPMYSTHRVGHRSLDRLELPRLGLGLGLGSGLGLGFGLGLGLGLG